MNKNTRGTIVGMALVGKLPMTKNGKGVRVVDIPKLVDMLGIDEADAQTALAWADGNWGGWL